MHGLSHRQKQVLDWIRAYISKNSMPPTIREIGDQFGIRSTNGVNDHLLALERKGFIRREELKSRSIRVVGMAAIKPDVSRAETALLDALLRLRAAPFSEDDDAAWDRHFDAKDVVIEKAEAWARLKTGDRS